MKTRNIIIIVVSAIVVTFILRILLVVGLVFLISNSSELEVNTDISKYNDYIFEKAKEKYRNKWDMDESIFPKNISNNVKVVDYKMVYYNPWDAQFLSYLVVDYDNSFDYQIEVNRLNNYHSTPYLGYYNVTGFSKYKLLAMYADSYNGFVYALTDNEQRIIYVELIFCNYFYDLDYKKYIEEDYLPDGFDASNNNSYMRSMLKERIK